MSQNCLEGLKAQFSDIFWTISAYLVDAFVWRSCPMHARYNFSQFLANRSVDFSRFFAKETPEFLDKIEAGDFTLKAPVSTFPCILLFP